MRVAVVGTGQISRVKTSKINIKYFCYFLILCLTKFLFHAKIVVSKQEFFVYKGGGLVCTNYLNLPSLCIKWAR